MNLRALVALVAITIPSGPAIKTPVPASGVVYTPPFSGSKQRPASSKLSDVVSVRDFGAVGDGVADDTAAVQAAYAALTSGGALYFPRGTYLFNLTIARSGVSVRGESPSATTFKPQDKTIPVLQVGDGTTSVEQITLSDFSMVGDNATATSDALYQYGARYVNVQNVIISAFGGDGIKISSSATRASTYSTYKGVYSVNNKGACARLSYGALFTTAIAFIGGGLAQSNTLAGSWALYLDGVDVRTEGMWIDAPTLHGVYMRYDSVGGVVAPFWRGGGTTTLDGALSTDVLVDIDLVGTAFNHLTSTQFLDGVNIDGQVKWDVDATVVSMKGTYPNRMRGATELLGPLAFNGYLNDSRDEQDSPTTRILQGGGSAGNEFLDVAGAALRVPGTPGKDLMFASGGHFWRSANGMLRYLPSGTPSADTQGISVTPHRQAITYSASMTINVALGTWAYIAATNGTAFTINAPTSGAAPISNATDQRITITISNQSGGALGVITWNAAFKMAAFTAPATGFSRSVDFQYDGTNWIQVGHTNVDVPN